MSLMKRIKDILFDEEEVEIPVIESKKEQINKKRVEPDYKDDSITEIKIPDDNFSDKETLKSEMTFPFPIEFEENELEKTKPIHTFDAPKREEVSRVRERDSYNRYEIKKESKPAREIKDYSSYLKNKEEKKQFKPTPIISPVYGVLDQNYKKEDVIVKKEIKRDSGSKSKLDLDEIRKKAYGDSEEIISITDVEDTKELEIIDVDVPIDPNKTIGEMIEEESMVLPELDKIKEEEPTVELSDLINEKENIERKLESSFDEDEDESDLFSLIDSMYEENNE